MPAELARSLVAQYTRGAQGILADCLDKKFGEPAPLSETAVDTEHKNERSFGASTLESLSIQNFRAYRKKRTFAFGSAVTVLYGPNGFGKTSFFDALDFAVTGGIGRLPATMTNQAFAKAAKHLDSGTEDSMVSLTFKRGEQTHSVVRNLSNPKHATMDSKVVERKDVLSKLTGGEATTADRVDNFVSLFRATHLFSQESQELTRDFEVKCELSSDLVSRMLAFEDYVNGIKKTSEVQGHIKTTIDRANIEVKRVEALAEKDREELTRLEGLAAAHANPGAIESELLLLRQHIANTGINVASDVIDTPSLRGWRAQLESRIARASGQAVQLSKAIGDLQQVRSLGVELSAVQSTVKQVSESLAETERALATVEGLHRTADGQHSQLKAGEGIARRAFDSLNWIAQVKPEFDRLIGERATSELALRTAGQQETSLRNDESATAAARKAAETALSNFADQVLAGSSRLQALQSVGRQKPEVNAANERLKQLVETERARVTSTAQARLQLEQVGVTRQSSLVEMARAERDVATRDAEVTEVRSLLAQLRGHVTEGTCLLCGVDHGSAEALLARIDARLIEERPISEARERLTRHRSDVTQLTEKEASLQQALNDSQEHQERLRSERQRLERLLSEFSDAAAALGIVVPAKDDWPAEVLNLTTRQEEQALAILSNQREGAVQSRNAAIKASDDAKAAFAANAAAMRASKGNLDRTNQAIGRLVADPRRGTIDLETAPKELHAMLDAAAEKLQTIKTEVAAALTIADQRKAEVARKAQEVGTAKKALEAAQRRTGDITTGISALTSSLAQLGLNSNSSGQSVTDLMAGQIHFVFASMPVVFPHMKTGRLRTLAITGSKRTPLAPDLPTVAEAGIPGYAFDSWWGLVTNAAVQPAIINTLNTEVRRVLQLPDVKERFTDLGIDVSQSTPAELATFTRAEIDRFAKVIRDTGIRAD